MSRVAASGRVPASGRVAASGRVSSVTRQGVPFRLGLKAFYRPDAGAVTLSNGKVSKLADLSGHGYHLTQSTSSKRPTWNSSWLNGAPSLTFSGGQVLSIATTIQSSRDPWTMGVVFQASSIFSARCMWLGTNGTGGHALVINGEGSGKREIRAQGASDCTDGTATTNPEVWIATATAAAGSTSSLKLYTGVSQTSQSLTPNPVTTGTISGNLATMGGISTSPLFPFVGDIGEVFFVDRVLTASEITAYLAYVAQRYGSI